MAKINLRDYYPFYQYDSYVDVPDEVADALLELDRIEATYQRRLYRYRSYYSLDCNDGIECMYAQKFSGGYKSEAALIHSHQYNHSIRFVLVTKI